jgi:integrase
MADTMSATRLRVAAQWTQAALAGRAETPPCRLVETPAKPGRLSICISRNMEVLNLATMITEDSRVGRAFRRVCGPDADIYEAGAVSDASWFAYDSGVTNWTTRADLRGVTAFPAPTDALKEWIIWMVDEGYSAATIDCYVTAVSIGHDERNMPINRRALRKVLKAARDDAASKSPPRKAAPLRATETRALLKACNIKSPADCRDASGTLIMVLCGLRQNELTTLDWMREGPPSNGRRGYMRPVRGGYEVILLKSKTSKKPHTFTITNRDAPSLRKWLDAWLAHAKIEPGTPLFRGVDRWQRISVSRLKPPAICAMLRRRMLQILLAQGAKPDEAYLEAQRWSGHSPRRGLVTETADRGVSLPRIQARSRHKDVRTLVGYVEVAEDKHNSAVKGLRL